MSSKRLISCKFKVTNTFPGIGQSCLFALSIWGQSSVLCKYTRHWVKTAALTWESGCVIHVLRREINRCFYLKNLLYFFFYETDCNPSESSYEYLDVQWGSLGDLFSSFWLLILAIPLFQKWQMYPWLHIYIHYIHILFFIFEFLVELDHVKRETLEFWWGWNVDLWI